MKLDRLDLNKLYAFFAIAEHGGISAAARRLSRTRSAVSQSLAALEASLERRLFDRVGKRLVLTREGELLYRRFREYQSMLQGTVDEIVNEDGAVRGPIWLGLFHGFPSSRLAEFIARFLGEHRDTSLRIVHAPVAKLTRRLLRGRLDFVLSFRPARPDSPRIATTKLYDQELVLVAARAFFRSGFDLVELRRTPVIDYYQSAPLISRWLAHHFGPDAEPIAPRVWAATTDLALELVQKRVGVAVVPAYLAGPLVRARRLRILDTGQPPLSDSVWLNERRDGYKSPAHAAFRRAVFDEFSNSTGGPSTAQSSPSRRAAKSSGGSSSSVITATPSARELS